MSDERHGLTLPEVELRTHCEDGDDRQRIGSHSASQALHMLPPARQNGVVGAWFGDAVSEWGKAQAFAETIGVTASMLSEMRHGKRVVYLRHVLPLLAVRPAAAKLIGWQCERAGFQAPRLRSELRLTAEERSLLLDLRKHALWPYVGPVVAQKYGCELDLLEAALDYEERR